MSRLNGGTGSHAVRIVRARRSDGGSDFLGTRRSVRLGGDLLGIAAPGTGAVSDDQIAISYLHRTFGQMEPDMRQEPALVATMLQLEGRGYSLGPLTYRTAMELAVTLRAPAAARDILRMSTRLKGKEWEAQEGVIYQNAMRALASAGDVGGTKEVWAQWRKRPSYPRSRGRRGSRGRPDESGMQEVLLLACARAGDEDGAFRVVDDFRRIEGCEPTVLGLRQLLGACRSLRRAREVLTVLRRRGFEPGESEYAKLLECVVTRRHLSIVENAAEKAGIDCASARWWDAQTVARSNIWDLDGALYARARRLSSCRTQTPWQISTVVATAALARLCGHKVRNEAVLLRCWVTVREEHGGSLDLRGARGLAEGLGLGLTELTELLQYAADELEHFHFGEEDHVIVAHDTPPPDPQEGRAFQAAKLLVDSDSWGEFGTLEDLARCLEWAGDGASAR
eukprot:Hpha_TRINITY_DN30264_c0_g1::TRINITY_DN30264_c0_g1_i1::g.27115::m.27115